LPSRQNSARQRCLVLAAIEHELLGLGRGGAPGGVELELLGERFVALALGLGEEEAEGSQVVGHGQFFLQGSGFGIRRPAPRAASPGCRRGGPLVHVLLQQPVHRRVQPHRQVEVGVVAGHVGAELDQVARLLMPGMELAEAPRRVEVAGRGDVGHHPRHRALDVDRR
jgi:hypothetical protein